MADETELKTAPPKDEMQVTLGPSLGQTKVELDLDDAPFLQPTEDDLPAEQEDNLPAAPEDQAAAQSRQRKKKLLLAAGAGVGLLLILGAAVWWFFLRTPPPAPEALKPEVIVVPSKPAVKVKPDYVKEFAPFLVPRNDGKGGARFLVCKFSAVSKDAALSKEMDQKMISLRDAMYYYLRSKSSEYLMDPRNGPAIKKDLTSVLNDYLTQGKIEDILFESYLNE
ncbi:flagellar basal body-associated protein FliL [Desulfovibrio sp.]|uniref:flagellar basal body-associated FliL family protein n=1 Tax=Desulfovibrio sp. TaxID=885 RepID=UPI0025BCA836|nr:flagellar basal body-associated FliL family protein [Desulfovibrio sp.]